MPLSSAFDDALLYASRLHRNQVRKLGQTPYIHHLLAVASLVGETGGREAQVIAALLHDAIEDQGGEAVADEILRRFGKEVHAIVLACTDTHENPKPPWRPRKEAWLERLKTIPSDALLVVLADKVHNAGTMLMDARRLGADVWSYFSGGREGTLWYLQAVADLIGRRMDHPLVDELQRLIDELRSIEGGT